MKKPLPKNSKTGALGIAALIVMALLLLPMAAGPHARAEENRSEAMPLSREQAIEGDQQTMTMQIEAYNRGDLDTFLSLYTVDAISLMDQTQPGIGTLGLQMNYRTEFDQGNKILDYGCTQQAMWSCGRYLIAASQGKAMVKVPSLTYLVTVVRNYLIIYETQPDGTLKIKMEAWNNAQMPSDPQALRAIDPLTDATFHAIPAGPMNAAALNEQIETVKQLDIEFHQCFNRQDQEAALAFYTDDAMLMTVNQDPIHGRPAIAAHVADSRKQTELVNNNHQVIHAEGNAEMVILVNQFGWVFKVLATGETVSVPGKGIHVWQKQPDGNWKILLDIHNTNIPLS